MRHLLLCSVAGVVLACDPAASAAGSAAGSAEAANVIVDFSDSAEAERWGVVNDGVMGGKSEGAMAVREGAMRFAGVIRTDGGGFSSVRRGLAPGALAGAEAVRLRVRGDARGYRVSFRDDTRTRWGGRVMFAAPLNLEEDPQESGPRKSPDADAAEAAPWQEVVVRFEDLSASFHGRPMNVAPFDPGQAREIGLILSDGIDGPFELEVAWIEAEANPEPTAEPTAQPTPGADEI